MAEKTYLPYAAEGDGVAAVRRAIGPNGLSGAAHQSIESDTQTPGSNDPEMPSSITQTKAFSDALVRARSKDRAEIESLKAQNEQVSSILAHLGLPADPFEAAVMLAQEIHGGQSGFGMNADEYGNQMAQVPFGMGGFESGNGLAYDLENDLRILGHVDAQTAILQGAHETLMQQLLDKPFVQRTMRDKSCFDTLHMHRNAQNQLSELQGLGADVGSLTQDPTFLGFMGNLSDSLTMPQKWELYQQYVVPAAKQSKTPPPSVRSTSQNNKADYFSEDQVDNMSRDEVLANLDAINTSMARWNRRR